MPAGTAVRSDTYTQRLVRAACILALIQAQMHGDLRLQSAITSTGAGVGRHRTWTIGNVHRKAQHACRSNGVYCVNLGTCSGDHM